MTENESVTKPIGLRERIAAATTEEEIKDLLRTGDAYIGASDKTHRAWVRTAKRRSAELSKVVAK